MNNIIFNPIGIIHSPFKEQKGTPIQPRKSDGAEGTIEIYDEFVPGLDDLDGFSHIYLLFHFHFLAVITMMIIIIIIKKA